MHLLFTLSLFCISIQSLSQQSNHVTLYFHFASDKLTESSQQKANEILNSFKSNHPSAITITGHSDKSGSESYNLRLSGKRVETIHKIFRDLLPSPIEIRTDWVGEAHTLTSSDSLQQINRRVEITWEYPIKDESTITLQPYSKDVATQTFSINLDDTVKVIAREGTYIEIPPGSIQDKNGLIKKGDAILVIREYYNTGTILLSGLHTLSDKGLLQTGGMFHLAIIQDADTMDTRAKKHITIRMPQYNKQLTNMSVFSMSKQEDTAQWKNSGSKFSELPARWLLPERDILLGDVHHERDQFYTGMRVGNSFSEEYFVAIPFFHFLNKKYQRPLSKKVHLTTCKIDETTVNITAAIRYRQKGYKTLGIRNCDTSYSIKFERAKYEGKSFDLNWINCDRFLEIKNKIDFTVSTPGYRNISVMVYFKDLRAFLPAQSANKIYKVKGVPDNIPVTLVAMGKLGNHFYFGKQETTTRKNANRSIAVTRVAEADIKKFLDDL